MGKNPTGGRPAKEYALTVDMAKELAMVDNSDQGSLILAGPAWAALPAGYIDPSNVTIKTGKMQIDNNDEATVNFSLMNTSRQTLEAVAVACTALIDDDPVETSHDLPGGIAPGQKVYGSVNFFKVAGNKAATASCRVEYIKVQ